MTIYNKIYEKVEEARDWAEHCAIEWKTPTAFISYPKFRELRQQLHAADSDPFRYFPYFEIVTNRPNTLNFGEFYVTCCAGLLDDEIAIAPIEKM